MEKSKPYKCEACGKRYKNLNGLKYHKSHSPACADEKTATQDVLGKLKPDASMAAAKKLAIQPTMNTSDMGGLSLNGYPGAGLPGIDEEMIM